MAEVKPLLRSPKRVLIDTAGKWREVAPPERWGRGKALTELAERWITTEVPEVDELLASHKKTAGFVAAEGEAGGRELDLVIEGDAPGGRTLLVVVPIAEDGLGPNVQEAFLRSATNDRLRGGVPPITHMAQRVFNVEPALVRALRYRFLEQCSRMLVRAEARGCAQAALVFHEIRTPLTSKQVMADQRADCDAFMQKLAHRGAQAAPGKLIGPAFNATKVLLFAGRALVEKS
jgi:hypothetical protein